MPNVSTGSAALVESLPCPGGGISLTCICVSSTFAIFTPPHRPPPPSRPAVPLYPPARPQPHHTLVSTASPLLRNQGDAQPESARGRRCYCRGRQPFIATCDMGASALSRSNKKESHFIKNQGSISPSSRPREQPEKPSINSINNIENLNKMD
jgi:hypothetical protein